MDLNTSLSVQIGPKSLAQGPHRLSVQLDFRSGEEYLAAWVDSIQQAVLVNGVGSASYPLPAGTTFVDSEGSELYVARDGIHTAMSNCYGYSDDWTFAGLSLSNSTRYTVSTVGSTQARADSQTLNDNLRYFTNDAYTIGLLLFDDTPPAATDYTNPAWTQVRIQSGQAATPAGQNARVGYGWWVQEPWTGYTSYSMMVANLTLQKLNSSYGSDVCVYNSYGINLTNATLNGGFTAFNVLPHGDNEYTNRFYNVSLNASYAGYVSIGSTMSIASGLTFPSPGKHAIITDGGYFDWRNVTIGPASYSDYLVKDYPSDWLSTIFSGLTIQPDPNHTYPTKGVFFHERCDCGKNLLRIENCSALNLPPGIVFVELPDGLSSACRNIGDLAITAPNFSVYGDGKLAAFVRGFSPRWYGRINGCTNALSQYVTAWIDSADTLPWTTTCTTGNDYNLQNYYIDDMVSHNGKLYRCISPHGDLTAYPLTGQVAAHEPGVAADWQNYWMEQEWCNIKFIHPDFTALPSSGNWVQGSDIVQIPGNPNGSTEYRCVASGSGSTALWARWHHAAGGDADRSEFRQLSARLYPHPDRHGQCHGRRYRVCEFLPGQHAARDRHLDQRRLYLRMEQCAGGIIYRDRPGI